MINRLKQKWGIDSNRRFWLIIFIFSISGSSTLFVKIPVFNWLDITSETPLWERIGISLLIITPAYQVIVLFYAFLLGEFRFFWAFEKKIFGRFRKLNT